MLPAAGDLFFRHTLHPFYLFLQNGLFIAAVPGWVDTNPVARGMIAYQFPQSLFIGGNIPIHSFLPGGSQEEIISSQAAIQMQ